MSKVIKYNTDASISVRKGIDAVADIVKTTVGPKGRNVLIREALNTPIITNDGVTIAKNIQLKDNGEDAGASLVISAANKTNNVAGDGTTTTTILTQAIINEYYKYTDSTTNNINPVQIQKEILASANTINDYLLKVATPAKDIDSIKRVATISSGDEHIGDLIAQGFKQAGEFGTVMVEDSKTGMDYLDSVEGMKFNNGMITPYLLNDRTTMKTIYEDAKVFVTTEHLDNIIALMPLLDMCIKQNLRLLILCSEMDIEPLNTIIMNKAQGLPINVAIVRLPGYGQLKDDLTEDICIATGANLITRDTGRTLQDITLNDLGEVKEVIVTQDDTILKFKDTLTLTTGDVISLREARNKRAQELKARLNEVQDSEKEQYKRRISNLISGISAIKVSGNSEVEIKDKKLRIEDAINSVESAREEGIVPGGGYSFLMALMHFTKEAEKEVQETGSTTVDTIGDTIIRKALEYVTKQIAINAGFDGDEVVNNCYEKHLGFNALTEQYEDLLQTGIINSVKTDRYSLLNAASVAATVITMGGMIIEENEKDRNIFTLEGTTPGIITKM